MFILVSIISFIIGICLYNQYEDEENIQEEENMQDGILERIEY